MHGMWQDYFLYGVSQIMVEKIGLKCVYIHIYRSPGSVVILRVSALIRDWSAFEDLRIDSRRELTGGTIFPSTFCAANNLLLCPSSSEQNSNKII